MLFWTDTKETINESILNEYIDYRGNIEKMLISINNPLTKYVIH